MKCSKGDGCTRAKVHTIRYKLSGLEREPYTERIIGQKDRIGAIAELQRRVGKLVRWPTVEERVIRSVAH